MNEPMPSAAPRPAIIGSCITRDIWRECDAPLDDVVVSTSIPNLDPSPSSHWNDSWSCGVVMTRTSLTPASISVESG